MYTHYSIHMVYVLAFICAYGYADPANVVANSKSVRKEERGVQVQEDGSLLRAFEALLRLLAAEQGENMSQDMRTCQQKFAKNNKRIPKELPLILPDIYAYVEKLHNQVAYEREQTSQMINALLEMRSSLTELRTTLIQTVNVLGSESKVQVGDSNTLVDCQILGIRQILCDIAAKVDVVLVDLQELTAIVSASKTLSEEILSNTHIIIAENTHFINETFAQLADVVGTKDHQSYQVTSIDDINTKLLSLVEWLKTTSAQLLEIKNLVSSDCIDRYWMNK